MAVRQHAFKGMFALVAAILLSLAVGATEAAAAINLQPSTRGAGKITTYGGSSPAYVGCDNTDNQNDNVVAGCPAQTIAAGRTCNILGCFPLDTSLVLEATPAVTPAGHWSFAGWQNCPSTSGTLCTIPNPWISTSSASPRAIFNDSVGPTVTSLTTNYSTTVDRGVSFSSTANETLSAIECQIDRTGAFTPCATVRQLPEGTHTVRAQGTDRSGNLGSISGTLATFRIIDTELVGGPPQGSFSNDPRPTFTYSTLAGISFQCSIDSVSVTTPCGTKNALGQASFTPTSDLPDGVHTFRVRALDGPDFDRVPLRRAWTVDTVAPSAAIDSAAIPDGVVTTLRDATFTFTSTEAPASLDHFECSLDGAAFAACASPHALSGLAFGGHELAVRAVDKAGNVGAAVKRAWTIMAPDNDGDGFDQRTDCDDGDLRINPLAPDLPGNGVDENCDGADAAQPLDVKRPAVSLSVARQKLSRALRRGIAARFRTDEAGRAVFEILADSGLLARRVRLARGTKTVSKAGRYKIAARFTKKAKRKLAGKRNVRLTLRLTVTDATGNRTRKTKRVKLVR